jgi:hypothetical protein
MSYNINSKTAFPIRKAVFFAPQDRGAVFEILLLKMEEQDFNPLC